MDGPSRRQVLSGIGSGVAAGGLAVLGAVPATATHPHYVETRGHYDSDGYLVAGETETSYDTCGDVPGVDDGCVSDLTVLVHGFNTTHSEAKDFFHEGEQNLSDAGYSGTVVGYSWDSDYGDTCSGFDTAERVAQDNGPKLAEFTVDFIDACSDASIRYVSHSLGAQVVLSALRDLDDRGWPPDVADVHMMAAAQDNEAPTYKEAWTQYNYNAIKYQTGGTYNYWNSEDNTLEWLYSSCEADNALGETGAESGEDVPANYDDVDVSDEWGGDHSSSKWWTHVSNDIYARM